MWIPLPFYICLSSAPLQVEAYMGKVVDKMRSELRGVMGGSVLDYPAKKREQWMFNWPSQVALVSAGGGVWLHYIGH